MLILFSALVAAVPPAAPLPIVRTADHHLDELKLRAQEVEEAIKDLHRELEEIERAMEREAKEQRGAARRLWDLGEQEEIFVVEMDGDSGRQVMVDGDRSELIERLVEQLEGREGGDGERMRRVLVGLGEGEPLIELGGDDAPGGVFVFETDGDEHDDDHHEGHHEEHHDAHHHDEIVREFEFPGGHGEIRIEVDVEGIEGEEVLEPLLEQLMGAELPMISAFDAPDGVVILEGHDGHGFDGELEEMLHELGIDLDDLHGHGVRQRVIRIGAEDRHHDEHHDEGCEDEDGHHEDHDEGSVHHFEFPGGHGEIHVGVELHGDHGDDDHGHEGDLEEMLHELGIDLDGREMHIEMEVESEDEHGHHVEHRVIRIGGEHGHHDEHDHDEEWEDEGDHHGGRWHDGHHDEEDHDHEGHDGHPDEVIVIGPGLDRRVRWRSNAPVPIEFDLEELELRPGVVDLSRRVDGRRRVRLEQRRSDPRERREIMEGMRRRAMERRAQADRGGFPEELQQAVRELQEEMRAMRREMNEMRRRLDRR